MFVYSVKEAIRIGRCPVDGHPGNRHKTENHSGVMCGRHPQYCFSYDDGMESLEINLTIPKFNQAADLISVGETFTIYVTEEFTQCRNDWFDIASNRLWAMTTKEVQE